VSAAGPGDDCDAALAPVVTGRIDHDLAARLARRLARIWAEADPRRRPCGHACRPDNDDGQDGQDDMGERERNRDLAEACAREMILRHAVALLSGPDGLAAWLRTGTLPGPAASVSLPLDVGAVTDLIPPHLRRAIITRDRHCAAPGCDQPPQACHVHHIVPRSRGGATSLANCLLLCPFHHLILIHRWGWQIALHADGTTTMTSPDGRTLHSHSPPEAA
jgi:HNH endonuclease